MSSVTRIGALLSCVVGLGGLSAVGCGHSSAVSKTEDGLLKSYEPVPVSAVERQRVANRAVPRPGAVWTDGDQEGAQPVVVAALAPAAAAPGGSPEGSPVKFSGDSIDESFEEAMAAEIADEPVYASGSAAAESVVSTDDYVEVQAEPVAYAELSTQGGEEYATDAAPAYYVAPAEAVDVVPGESSDPIETIEATAEPSESASFHHEPAVAAPATLTVKINGGRRCLVTVCGEKLGRAPFMSRTVPVGEHNVRIKCPKRPAANHSLQFIAGENKELLVDLPKGKKARKGNKRRRRR